MSKRRIAVAALLVLAMLFTFAGTCTGLNSEEGHQTVVDTGSRWLDFNKYIGLLPAGELAVPWITQPIDGSSAGDTVQVEGLAMSAVRAGTPDKAATVKVYILPGNVAAPEEQYLAGTADIDDKGNWKLSQEAELWAGRNTIAAVAHYGDKATDPGSVVIVSSSSKEPPAGTGTGKVDPTAPPKRASSAKKVRIAVVAVRPKGAIEFGDGLEDRLRTRVKELHDFYDADSYGAIDIVGTTIDAGPGGKGYDLPQDEKTYHTDGGWYSFVDDTLKKVDLKAADYDIVFCVQSGHAPQDDGKGPSTACSPPITWGEPKKQGSFIVISDSTDRIGGWAHETGHALGQVLRGGSNMPDLYESSEFMWTGKDYWPLGYPGYTNLHDGAWQPYVLMGSGNWNPSVVVGGMLLSGKQTKPPQNIALCKMFLGWLRWDEHKALPWVFVDPSIETADYDAAVPVYKHDDESSYIFEMRSSTWWSNKLPSDSKETRLFIYKTRYLATKRDDRASHVSTAWPDYVNGVALLQNGFESNPYFIDPDLLIVCRLESLSQDQTRVKGRVSVSVADRAALVTPMGGGTLAGSIMKPSGVAVPTGPGAAGPISFESVPTSNAPVQVPDLDLHAYLADGRHVGVNYKTGVFENPVKGALISGDLVGDTEWILLPKEDAAGAKYVVYSNEDTRRYIVRAEKAGADVSSVKKGLDYTLVPTTASGTKGIDKGKPQTGTLAPDKRVEFDVASSENASPTIGGVAVTTASESAPDRTKSLYLPLGIAAGCLVLALLTWLVIALVGRRRTR